MVYVRASPRAKRLYGERMDLSAPQLMQDDAGGDRLAHPCARAGNKDDVCHKEAETLLPSLNTGKTGWHSLSAARARHFSAAVQIFFWCNNCNWVQ